MAFEKIELLARQWIQAAQEKVDVWKLKIRMGKVTKLICRMEDSKNYIMGSSKQSK
jgi:hypothetical protein